MGCIRLQRVLARIAVAAIVVLVWLGGCGEGTGPCNTADDCVTSDSVIVSNPVGVAALAGFNASRLSATGNTAEDDLVYVALTPGTIPDGSVATVRRVGATNTVTASIRDGGLDPVPVVAQPGDAIEIVVTGSSAVPVTFRMAVPVRRRPVVVRADPPPRKRDVPLNAGLVLVFNEPVASGSLVAGVRLFRGDTPIPGTVELLGGTATAAIFRPSGSLDMNADYRLVASAAVRDVSGDPLETEVAIEFTTGQTFQGTPNSIVVVPDTSEILIGSQVQVTGSARDSSGNPVHGVPFVWVSDNPSVATVSDAGLVTARTTGVAHISGGGAITGPGVATVFVVASQARVASVAITPDSATIPLGPGGGTVRLSAVLRDSGGAVLPFRRVQWSSSNPAIANVAGGSGGKALVTGSALGSVTITATSEGISDSVTLTLVPVGPFTRVLAGGPDYYNHGHTCGVTADAWVLCWGVNQYGQTGTGIGGFTTTPVGLGGIPMSVVTPSLTRSCGLMPDGSAYCWGSNMLGGLGIGTISGPESCFLQRSCSQMPIAVLGGFKFTDIGVGDEHACGLSQTGAVQCWGYNGFGQLGTGSNAGPQDCSSPEGYSGFCSPVPIAVIGGQTFTTLSVGRAHACALTASGAAYCWGENRSGALGDSTNTDRPAPVRVAGGQTFIALSASGAFTCGLAADSTAYCWGENWSGQLGIGTAAPDDCFGSPCSKVPVAVATSLKFAALSRGNALHMCALTAGGQAYCWGYNEWGQLGTGSTSTELVPVPVSGGLTFAHISVALFHSCGVTTDNIGYCWGDNAGGQLGTGSLIGSPVPVRVVDRP